MPTYFVEFLSQCSQDVCNAFDGWVHDRGVFNKEEIYPFTIVDDIITVFRYHNYCKIDTLNAFAYVSDNACAFLLAMTKENADLYFRIKGLL